MSDKTSNSFIKGAMILAVSNILIKVLGALIKIPLTNIAGEYAMGLYSTAYNYYTILLTIATAGLPIAISKMISESRALGKASLANRIFKMAVLTCACLGMFGTIVMLLAPSLLQSTFPSLFSLLFHDPNAVDSFLTLAPAVLFIAITAAFRGYFQGHNDMLPTAISQIIETLCRLIIGLAVAYIFIMLGFDERFVAAGAISGITAGTLLAGLFLIFIYFRRKKKNGPEPNLCEDTLEKKQIFKNMMSIAIPVTIGALVITLTNTIDTIMIPSRLESLGKYATERVTELWGIYSTYVMSMFNLVPNVLISINASITPVVAAAYARKDNESLHQTLTSALRLVIIISAPAAVGISVLAHPILSFFFGAGENALIGAGALSILSIGALFLCISSLVSTILQSLGKASIPVYNMLIGAALKLLANFFLIAIPGVELMGAAVGTVICYVAIAILNLFYLSRFIGFKPNFARTYLRPIIATLIMGAVAYLTYSLTGGMFSSMISGRIGTLIPLGLAILAGVISYGVVLIAIRGVTREDAKLLPKGDKIANLLRLK